MWYVIQTTAGKEHEVCMWINTFVDKSLYRRCFVPLYEDVWRKEGIGHISIRKLFSGYLFVETDTPKEVYDALKDLPKMSVILSSDTKDGKLFLPLHKEEEVFFDTILSDGIMKVSFIHMNHAGRINQVIGPLQSFLDNIVRVDIPHRRAIVDVPIIGEVRRLKFGLWLDIDPKLDWIEAEKKNKYNDSVADDAPEAQPENPWDWKAWKKVNESKKHHVLDEEVFGYNVGDYVVNTTGIYGDAPLEIVEIRPGKNSVVVNVMMFGSATKVEMGIDDVELVAE